MVALVPVVAEDFASAAVVQDVVACRAAPVSALEVRPEMVALVAVNTAISVGELVLVAPDTEACHSSSSMQFVLYCKICNKIKLIM